MAQSATSGKKRGGDGSTLSTVLEKKSERIPYEVIEEERMPGSRIRFKLKLTEEAIKDRLEETMTEYTKAVRLPGFRPGKAPKNLVRRSYETPAREDTVKRLTPRLAEIYAEDKGLDALTDAHLLDWKSTREDGTTVEIALEVRPEITLTEETLQGLRVKAHKVNVDDAYVEKELESLRLRNATYEPTEDGYQPHDGLLFTCTVSTPDGIEIPSRSVKEYYSTKVEEELPEEVAAAVVGKKKDEQLVMDIEEPSEMDPSAKETVHYELEVHEVKRRVLPELDDEFAQDVNEKYKTLDELREDVRKQASQREKDRQRSEALNLIFEELRKRLDFDLPRAMVEDTRNRSLMETEQRLNQMGMSLDSLGQNFVGQIAQNMHERAKVSVKNSLIMKKLQDFFAVDVSEEDVQAELAKLGEIAGRKPLAIRAEIEKEKRWEGFLDHLRVRKTSDALLEKADVDYKEVTREEMDQIEKEREAERAQAEAKAAAEAEQEAPEGAGESGPEDAPALEGDGEEPKP